MSLNNNFRAVVAGFINNEARLSEDEVLEASKLLVRKALLNIAKLKLKVTDSIVAEVDLKDITLTRNKKSKLAIYLTAQALINDEQHYCAMYQRGYYQAGLYVKKWRLVVWDNRGDEISNQVKTQLESKNNIVAEYPKKIPFNFVEIQFKGLTKNENP